MLTLAAAIVLAIICVTQWSGLRYQRRVIDTMANDMLNELDERDAELAQALTVAQHNYEQAQALHDENKRLRWHNTLLTSAVHTLPGEPGKTGELDVRA